jgi:hypothetical protein
VPLLVLKHTTRKAALGSLTADAWAYELSPGIFAMHRTFPILQISALA